MSSKNGADQGESSYDMAKSFSRFDDDSTPVVSKERDTSNPAKEATSGERRDNSSYEFLSNRKPTDSGSSRDGPGSDEDGEAEYDLPNSFAGLNNAISAVDNEDEDRIYRRRESLEESRRAEKEVEEHKKHHDDDGSESKKHGIGRNLTELYSVSYLILFAILGTLARLGLQNITLYPGAPVVFSEVWANFAGSLFFGFLGEDHKLFLEEWGKPKYHEARRRAEEGSSNDETGTVDLGAAKKAHSSTKKTIPLFIGLATGFCGSFTSFSSFMRDIFLALSNDLPSPLDHSADYTITTTTSSTVPRNGGYSFMALLAVPLVTVTLCMSALKFGAHLAIFSEPYTPTLPYRFVRKYLDPFAVFLGWGCWIGALILTIFPPDRSPESGGTWRGKALFAITFAPIGCLLRFYISLLLNSKLPAFPLGTFTVNMLGTALLGMSWDLQHVPLGGLVGCQVLQGIEDGFCGCLTTVSTWVGELSSLRRSDGYKYGIASILCGLALLVVIMGSLRWTEGFQEILCSH